MAVFANVGSLAADFIVVCVSTNEPLSKGNCGEFPSPNEMSGGGEFRSLSGFTINDFATTSEGET